MFTRLNIGTKIYGTIGSVLVLLVLVGMVSLAKLSSVAAVADRMGQNHMPSVTLLAKIRNTVDTYRRSELQLYLKNSEEEFKRYFDRMGKMQEEMTASREAFKKLDLSDEEKKQLAAFDTVWNSYVTFTNGVLEQIKAGKLEEAQKQTRGEGKKLYDASNKILGELLAFNQKEADEGVKAVHGFTSVAQVWIIVIILVGLLLGLLLGFMTVRSIRAPMRRLAADAEQIATGDLGLEVHVDSHDEVGQLARSFEKMVNSLRELIGRLADSSAEVSKSSVIMQSNSEQMATGAEEVASQAVTVATASEEMSATSGDIAQNCMLAAESAKRANDAADHGATVVESSIAVMKRIADRVQSSAHTVTELGQKSDQIGAIVGTIQDIADQTNLLALNAAIEAARAGEQGRGFAVVADEVRALAERTTKATKEISEMIKVIQLNTQTAVAAMEEGVAEVHNGTDEAARSGEALRNIQDEINAVNLQVQQIATAAEEQTATTSEITGNMHQITEVVGAAVERAHDTYNSAQHLSRLAEELQRVVGQFKLSESGRLITWSSSYSVQVGKMDQEHQRLIDIINKLYGAMREGRGKESIGAILDELVDYTKTHFAHEEQLMRDSGYAGYDEQKRAHENLISQVSEIQRKMKTGEALSQEVMSFLKNWLVNHIQGLDKQYGPHLNKKGVR